MIKIIIICAITVVHFSRADQNLYWRPFSGTIPEDAVPAAKEFGYNIYIGTAPYSNEGLFIAEALPGINSMDVSVPGIFGGSIHSVNAHMKILCSPNSSEAFNFAWVPALYSTLHQIEGLVEGGYEGSHAGVLYIGRAFVDNQMRIGKVVGYHVGDGQERQNILYIAGDSREIKIDSYEVLAYNGTTF